jgi:hypothetical protein
MPAGLSPGAGYRRLGSYWEEAIIPDEGNGRIRMEIVIWQKL